MRRTMILLALLAGFPVSAGLAHLQLGARSDPFLGNRTDIARITQCDAINQPSRALPACVGIIHAPLPAPVRSRAYTNRGVIYWRQGDADKAMTDFNQAILVDPNNVGAFVNRGEAYRIQNQFDRAIADFDRAVALDPRNAEIFNNRGSLYAAKGDFERAIAEYSASISAEPSATAYSNRGLAYLKIGRYELAMHDLDEAVRRDPNDMVAVFNRNVAKQGLDRAVALRTD